MVDDSDDADEAEYTRFHDLKNRDNDGWRIEWSDGRSRETSLVAMVWFAINWDDEATVIERGSPSRRDTEGGGD